MREFYYFMLDIYSIGLKVVVGYLCYPITVVALVKAFKDIGMKGVFPMSDIIRYLQDFLV